MADAFVGEIRIFGFTFPPADWAHCNGESLPLPQYQYLFSVIGVIFGGNGSVTFNLPNLQGSAVCHIGTGTGLTTHTIADRFGASTVTLTQSQIHFHNHALDAIPGVPAQLVNRPTGNAYLGRTVGQNDFTSTDTHDTTLAVQMVGGYGSSGPHENRQPFLALNFCICLLGMYPARMG